MIPSLLLLSTTLVASPVIISEVKATREEGRLRVDVRGDGGIDPESARTKIDDGRLFLFLAGTRVRADNRAWDLENGAGSIRAHRHHVETELVVPLAGNGCSGPVELTGTGTGLTAIVGCEGAVSASPGRVARTSAVKVPTKSAAKAPIAEAEEPTALEAKPAVAKAADSKAAVAKAADSEAADSKAAEERLKAVVALPPPGKPETLAPKGDGDVAADVPAVAKKKDARSTGPAAAIVEPPSSTTALVAATGPRAAVVADLTLAAPATGNGGSQLRSVFLPALLLLALAIGAYIVARRRRVTVKRHLQIVETISLGPKRSIVVARVGGETLVLASSEAGITLLKSSTTPAQAPGGEIDALAAVAAAAPAEPTLDPELAKPLMDALRDIPQPDMAPARSGFRAIEGGRAGGLMGMFGRRSSRDDDELPSEKVDTDFESLLEDSVEDQELRRKLAAGMSARVR